MEPRAEASTADPGDAGAEARRDDAGPAGGAPDPVAAGRAVEANDAVEARRRFGAAASPEATEYLAARIAEASGESAEAARLYEKVAAAGGALAARARGGLVRAYEAREDHAAAAAGLEALPPAVASALTAGERRRIAASRGRHLLALGRAADAVAAFDAAASSSAPDERLAIDLAEACAAAGETKRAVALLRPLAEDAKRAATMRRAAEALAKLGEARATSDAGSLARARRLLDLRAFDDAAEAAAKLAGSKDAKIAAEAAWLNAAQLYERRRHYKEAIEALDGIIGKRGARADEARWLRASALARDNREPEAIDAYREIRKSEKQPARAAEALFLASRLEFYIGRNRDALAGMERLVGTGAPKPKAKAKAGKAKKKESKSPLPPDRALEAHFIAGLAALLDGKAARAVAHLEAASEGEENAEALERNRYWRAVAREQVDAGEGAGLLGKICAADPTSWYAALARQRLVAKGADAAPCAVAPIPEAPPASDFSVPPLEELSAPAALLASVGLYDEAADELRGAEKAGGADKDDAFLRHYLALDAPRHAIRRASRSLGWPPGEADLFRARAAYPAPFADEVRRLEEKHGLPHLLLYAIARKESLFEPDAVSGAGALGMMQMMPATYEANRRLAGLPPLPADAVPGPHESLAAASFELAGLLDRFEGSLPLAIMAYNGGAAAVEHWQERAGGEPMDVFVEKAGFVETRNYVRRVYQNLVRYRLLEGATPPEVPASAPLRRKP